MPKDMMDLPVIGRAASVRPESINRDERTIEVVWTTGATVQRVRWEGWDDRIEYDETLEVTPEALRLDRLNAGGPFLNSHRGYGLESVLGSVVPGSVRIEGGKGYATIRLTEAEDAAPIVQRILEGTVRNVSVGYRVHQYEITKKDGEREEWRAVDWEPMEISAVAIPADPGSQTRSAESREVPCNPCVLVRSQESAAPAKTTKEAIMPNKNQRAGEQDEVRTEDTVQTRSNGGQAPATPETSTATTAQETRVDPEAAAQRAVAAERERSTTITNLCRRHGLDGDFSADLVARGVSVEDARTAILDKIAESDPLQGRSYEPAQPRGDSERDRQRGEALENALMHRVNPGQHELTAGGREFRGMSLLEIARDNLERRGVSTRGMTRQELAGAVFTRAAGYHTTSDFPIILGNLANRTLRDAYQAIPRTFTAWARRETLTDFKEVTRAQLSGAPDLEKVNEAGEFKYGTMAESKEVYQLSTYGRIIGFSRKMLINDDLSAFTRLSSAFGARAAELEGDIVYAILMQNPTMGDGVDLFHADHGNLGTAAVIDEAGLTAAYRAYAQQTGIEGHRISVSPSFLLTSPGQRAVEARKILTATTPAGTDDVNVYANKLQVIEERRLIPDSGQDPWFLSANPAMIDTVEYAYLEGQEGVFTETRMGFEVDGLEIKARHEFAAKAIDHRGLYKNPGKAPS
ncbi:prohead protease/major capsid protein fusion protein [Celeribacter halophilus]|uniref:Prohead serine protease n=1 Tax=Celeribacter halophilus TaxID=576117 RepID=A0A1I3WYM5_9RHOB|nr:prohead protease/major capsid protein fusion protein [Celeribacter halophilus]PZX03193.1 prohead serine protease [Celeribacter halophilus]SFK12500.1 prohead serine protease [Celeribacter halophilus]